MGLGNKARARILAVVVIGTLVLAGCSGPTVVSNPVDRSTAPVSRVKSTVDATPPAQKKVDALAASEAAVAAAVPRAGLVVDTTDIATPNGDTRMHLTVTADGDDTYTLNVSDFHTTSTAGHDLWLRQYPESPGDCITEGLSFGHTTWGGSFGAGSTPEATISLAQAGDDPSFLKNAVLTTAGISADCSWDVTAVVPLTWHTPNRHPNLRVVDSGAADGARGTTTRTSAGQPQTYTVAPNDIPVGIEARFGLTDRDLQYLTARDDVFDFLPLKTGQVLNLDPAAR